MFSITKIYKLDHIEDVQFHNISMRSLTLDKIDINDNALDMYRTMIKTTEESERFILEKTDDVRSDYYYILDGGVEVEVLKNEGMHQGVIEYIILTWNNQHLDRYIVPVDRWEKAEFLLIEKIEKGFEIRLYTFE